MASFGDTADIGEKSKVHNQFKASMVARESPALNLFIYIFTSYLGLISRHGVICGLSFLLVLYSALRGFSPGTLLFPSPQKTNIYKFQSDTGMHEHFCELLGTRLVNKLHITLLHITCILHIVASVHG